MLHCAEARDVKSNYEFVKQASIEQQTLYERYKQYLESLESESGKKSPISMDLFTECVR